jgi:hypothetical protein
LFPKREKSFDTISGAASYDISMLMTYVAAEKYLAVGRKLGFVLSQSIFKTSAAGQGFRRFRLPDGTALGPLVVEDLTELEPFEGASNRTTVGYFQKGHRASFPVAYNVWRNRERGRGSRIGFETPWEDVVHLKTRQTSQAAEPVNPSDPTSAWLTAAPECVQILRKPSGKSPYSGRVGLKCSVNGVFWLAILGKRPGGGIIVTNVTEKSRVRVTATQAHIEEMK